MNTFEALSAARDAIVKGWVQGLYHVTPDGYTGSVTASSDKSGERFCAIGSIQHALAITTCGSSRCGDETFNKSLKYLTHAMAQLGFVKQPRKMPEGQFSQIINFNDSPGRTKDEVLAAFNKAASNARRRHLNG